MRAHATRPEDAPELRVIIAGQLGSEVPLRPTSYLGPDGRPPQIVALVDEKRRVAIDIPPFEVRQCPPRRQLMVTHSAISNLPDQFELWARIVEPPADPSGAAAEAPAPFRPVRFHWDFGDDAAPVDTDTPIVAQSFRNRPQRALMSHVLITCTVEDADGTTLIGRDNLEMTNHGYEAFARHRVVALEFDQPRFPEPDARGVVTWPVHVWHHHTAPVTVTEIQRMRVDRSGNGADRPESVTASSLLGTRRISPSGVSFTVRLDTREDPDTSDMCSIA